jgi:hypothetical protein
MWSGLASRTSLLVGLGVLIHGRSNKKGTLVGAF